ncbi:hypothetical protein E5676_scaffold244G00540 [Cucumis melo var. makuwa]|uniref:Uncharacterized protein n=1 Tax=Cucumis melo var. makuwa TaxID=1194695 RepID=A0A5D3DUU8_CUCMM|nr:hypothetical protein E5676_scaffold244G00540 [Cucumis melo var. makuwa]
MLEFRTFTASVVGANCPLLGWFSIDCGVTVSFIHGVAYLTEMVSFGNPRLLCASFGITTLICVSFGITRLICTSFGITRLICSSFKITRLICTSDRITELIEVCVLRNHWTVYVRVWRGADQREARRMREGHVDASSF